MGTNKRYAASIDRGMDNRVTEMIMRSGEPLTLTDPELELDRYPLTRTPRPETVRAWVRYPRAAVQVEALMVAWTPRAAALEWAGPTTRSIARGCGPRLSSPEMTNSPAPIRR